MWYAKEIDGDWKFARWDARSAPLGTGWRALPEPAGPGTDAARLYAGHLVDRKTHPPHLLDMYDDDDLYDDVLAQWNLSADDRRWAIMTALLQRLTDTEDTHGQRITASWRDATAPLHWAVYEADRIVATFADRGAADAHAHGLRTVLTRQRGIPDKAAARLVTVADVGVERPEPELVPWRVMWSIDVWATSPIEAAAEALRMQRDPQSEATCFSVSRDGNEVLIDFDDPEVS